MELAKFGPGGNCESFKAVCSSSVEAPAWLRAQGLDLYEYECGRGVSISDEKALELGMRGREEGIVITLHAPYYISLSVAEPERRAKNEKYVLESCRAVKMMGGDRVVVHCGGLAKLTRQTAMENTVQGLAIILDAMENENLGDIKLCIETMGKINVLGDLDEVMHICSSDERLWPCIDFGHLNARGMGSIKDARDYEAILDCMHGALGRERSSRFHCHFSKVEYAACGEVRHLNFEDEGFGPEPDPLMRLVAERELAPTIVCESAGRQAEDALYMKSVYLKYMENRAR